MATHRQPELEELKRLLNEEIYAYTMVEEKMAQKNTILIQGDFEGLARLDQELLALKQKAVELEHKRLTLLVQMGQKNSTLQDFINCLDVDNVQPFQESRQRLLRVMENVKDLNGQNRSLLELSLKWIETSVETIAQLLTPEAAAYSARGMKKSGKGRTSEAQLPQSTVERSA